MSGELTGMARLTQETEEVEEGEGWEDAKVHLPEDAAFLIVVEIDCWGTRARATAFKVDLFLAGGVDRRGMGGKVSVLVLVHLESCSLEIVKIGTIVVFRQTMSAAKFGFTLPTLANNRCRTRATLCGPDEKGTTLLWGATSKASIEFECRSIRDKRSIADWTTTICKTLRIYWNARAFCYLLM